jgi:cyclopropane-fatty-acyl-phospholipid synthase
MKTAVRLVEKGLVPTPLVRKGIRRLLRDRLDEQRERFADPESAFDAWLDHMRHSPVALVPQKANEQHYELPPRFFELVLGPRLKYSSAYYDTPTSTLAEAEERMLALTVERAGIRDGMAILELGCGWGSLTTFMAETFPNSPIVAVSNSAPQREHIMRRAREAGLENLEVRTRDMNAFDTPETFDRVISVEMFEHMRNWNELLGRIARWLRPDGKLFLHFFAHERFAYPFEVKDASDWMSEHFFTGGMMPSHDLLERLDGPMREEKRWNVSGTHYGRTSEDWLANQEHHREEIMQIFRQTYGVDDAGLWFQRWRVFFLACAELFAYSNGTEWIVSHHLLQPRDART